MEVSERAFGNRFFIVAISSIVAFILMGLLVEQLDEGMVSAEEVQFNLRVAEMRSAVLLMEANLVAQSRREKAHVYVGSNPMEWMDEEETTHYLGEMKLSKMTKNQIEASRGNWFYDLESKVMRYFPNADNLFDENGQEAYENGLQFGVVGLWSEDNGQKKITGLRFKEVKE